MTDQSKREFVLARRAVAAAVMYDQALAAGRSEEQARELAAMAAALAAMAAMVEYDRSAS